MVIERRAVVGVMGSSKEAHVDKARPLGQWLARLGVHLLTGAGAGVMGAVSEAFSEVKDRQGLVLGIVPGDGGTPWPGYPNPWVEIPIFTHLGFGGERGTDLASRNHINILSSDVVVALPGTAGTASEVHLAVQYEKPVVAFVDDRSAIPELPDAVPAHAELGSIQQFVVDALGQLDRVYKRP